MTESEPILIKKFLDFVDKQIRNKEKKIAIIYHHDADGLCSAIVASIAIERIRGKKPELVINQERGYVEITSSTLRRLRDNKINCVITVDLCVDQKPENLIKLSKFSKVLIIDHHKKYKDLNNKNVVMIKAKDICEHNGAKYPASKLTYDLFSRIVDITDISWISSVGIIGDRGTEVWEDFVKESAKKAKTNIKTLNKVRKIIEGIETFDYKKFDILLREFQNLRKPQDIAKSELSRYATMLDEEIRKLTKNTKKNAEFYKDIELIIIKTKVSKNLKSPYINRISEKYPNKTIIVVEDSGKKFLGISARRQDGKIKVNELLENATKGLKEASGGGHEPAAGGRILKKDYEKFKQKVIEELENIYKIKNN